MINYEADYINLIFSVFAPVDNLDLLFYLIENISLDGLQHNKEVLEIIDCLNDVHN